jgi:hypothetical protein
MSDAQCAEDTGYAVDASYLWKMGAYVCVLTAASLRGHEGFMWNWLVYETT